MKHILFASLLVLAALAMLSCQKDSIKPTAIETPQKQFSDTNLTYLYGLLTVNDSIDSTDSFYKRNDTTFWIMKDSVGGSDTVAAVISVSDDTARVGGMSYSSVPQPLTITGLLAHGTGSAFEGSVWKVSSVSTAYNSNVLTTTPAPGSALYLYFNTINNKVYVVEQNDALNKLVSGLILECPIALYSPLMSLTGFVIDTIKSDCDTMWVAYLGQQGYVIGNQSSFSLDFYLLATRTKMYSIPLD